MAQIDNNNPFPEINRYPALFIGNAVTDFKRGKPYLLILTYEDPKKFKDDLEYYGSLTYLDRPLIIEDLSFIPENVVTTLLKFLEETKLKVILLSRFDKVLPTICSRVPTIIKRTDLPKFSFSSVQRGLETLEEKQDSPFYEQIRSLIEVSPKTYYFMSKFKSKSNREIAARFLQ